MNRGGKLTDRNQTGRLVREWYIEKTRFRLALENDPKTVHSFNEALMWRMEGDASGLCAYLRSDKPLTAQDRDNLACIFEGVFDLPPERGRPQEMNLRWAAMDADHYCRDWFALNEVHGISDWGDRGAMRDEAIAAVVEFGGYGVEFEAIRTFMRRPRSRRF